MAAVVSPEFLQTSTLKLQQTLWLHQTIHIQSIQSDLSLEPERLWFYSLCLLLNEHEAKLPAVMYVITHSTDNDAVFQTQRLPQDSKLLCDLIGQLPT